MPRYTQKLIFENIANGNEDILFYLSERYYQLCRRILRRKGCRDTDTPQVFANALVMAYREIQRGKVSSNIDLDNYIINTIKEYFDKYFVSDTTEKPVPEIADKQTIASCFSILESSNRQLLSLRYAELLSFEQIASRLNLSNPYIAEFEFNKAYKQLEEITKARLQIPH